MSPRELSARKARAVGARLAALLRGPARRLLRGPNVRSAWERAPAWARRPSLGAGRISSPRSRARPRPARLPTTSLARWRNNVRPEAVLALDVRMVDLDAEVAAAVASLAASHIHVALAGLEDASAACERIGACAPGKVVIADGERAVMADAGQPPVVVWERQSGAPFTEWLIEDLWRRGIGPGLVAVLPAGRLGLPLLADRRPARLARSMKAMEQERAQGALAGIDEAEGWIVRVGPGREDHPPAVIASLMVVSSGAIGLRADLEDQPGGDHFMLVGGAYGAGADGLVRPLPGPSCTVLADPPSAAPAPEPCTRLLDLRAGLVVREPARRGLRTVRFVSLARPGVIAVRAEDRHPDALWRPALAPPSITSGLASDFALSAGHDGGRPWMQTTSDRSLVVAAADQTTWRLRDRRRVERIVAVRSGSGAERQEASDLLALARRDGYDRLLDEHRQAWAQRWAAADIEIAGDARSQLAVRFALFHLLSCATTQGEAAVGARALTGLSYAGHVFWDTDVYVLPALAATLPAAARAVLEYRVNRLPAARDNAAARGLPGARFPWESADRGEDVTPTSARDFEGRLVPIRTGEHAEHINADIAWAIRQYLDWTGDVEMLESAGRDLVIETARYWQGRLRLDAAGRGHIYGVIGPDEYHEVVDDNAYTNNMARWHLRWAAALARERAQRAEATGFESAAGALVDGFDPATRRHEQFAGFWDLEPLFIGDIAKPPVAADVLLGRERVRRTQVIKQPDVLMLHHLLPDACPPGSLSADLEFYLARTAHGSSLSPAICAALIARDGRPDDAMELFDMAARIDLDDLTRTTTGGLHLATMGGLWQAVVYGFAGVRPTDAGLSIQPHLPRRWDRLSITLGFRGDLVRVSVDHEAIEVDAATPVPVVIEGRSMLAPVRVETQPKTGGRR